MSRIRSVHPGLWTDERFVSVSPLTRLLFIGLWNECDDQGIFEWSPLKLKMRLLPADNADAPDLLAEMEQAGVIMRFSVGDKAFGAVRNFTRFQRPKKPNSVHPITPLAKAFAAGTSEAVPNQFSTGAEPRLDQAQVVPFPPPTGSEIAPQRKEGGGRREESLEPDGSNGAGAPAPASTIDLKAAVFSAGVPILTAAGQTDRNARSMIGKWRQAHGDGAVLDALSAAAAERPSDPIPWINRALEKRYGNNGSNGSLRGARPDPSLDLLRQANAELAAERDSQEADRGAGPSLPALGPG